MNARIRVLEVTTSRKAWGAELASLTLRGPLAERGVDLLLAAPAGGDLVERWCAAPGAEFVALEVPERTGLRRADGRRPGLRQGASEVVRSIASLRPLVAAARRADVVHSNSLWAHLDCAVAGRLARRPVVLEIHDLVRAGLGRRLLSAAARRADRTIAISAAVADCVGSAAHARIEVLHPAVDLAAFAPGSPDAAVRRALSADPDSPLIGIVGRIDPEKGVDLVVRAVAELGGDCPAHLAVVGDVGLAPASYRDDVRREAEALLGPRVRFVGRTDDVAGTLRALDVVVNASVAEPFGLSLLEAQACGRAVVGTRAGGIPDFVDHGHTGLLVDRDVASLVSALREAVGSADLRERLGTAGRRQAEERFGVGRRADRLAEIYSALGAARAGRRNGREAA